MSAAESAETPLPVLHTSEHVYYNDGWGSKSAQTLVEFSLLWKTAQDNHMAGRAHNFDHGVTVLVKVNQLADQYELEHPDEPALDRKVMNAASLWHDAAEDEADAAGLFAFHAERLGYSLTESQSIQSAILSTAETVQPTTREEKVLGIGDLFNLGCGDDADVRAKSKDFMEEAREKLGNAFNERSYRSINLRRVANFITKDFTLGGFERDWLIQAHSTVRRMIREFAEDYRQGLPEVIKDLGSAAINLFGGNPNKPTER